ncbi:SCP-like protein [Ancylostoma caninum]|uniref:SCP-like protein n=1 Tax=Ancylostoma caninum TaxID=29170 RepID=A0A368GKW3_ANCCA|nr:SCP-like protein [Ancylostoma caninum]
MNYWRLRSCSTNMAARAVSLLNLLQAILLYYDGVASSTAFGCKNAMIPDEWRNMVLNHHNEYRRKLAKGSQAGSTGAALPYATKMSQLYWDCNVEELAREQADKCPNTAPNVATYGNSFAMIPAKGTCNTTAKIENQIKSWWKDGAKKQVDGAKVAGNDLFSQMAYEETTIVACSYKFCSGSLALVCLYNKDGAAQQTLYTSSNNKADICNACAAAAPCENALCNQRPAPVALEVKQCTNNAKKDLMTDDLRDQALNIHNYYRRLLATGWAKDAKLGYAKPATAMPKLEYDCAVEDTIMTEFETCGGTEAATNKAQNFVAYDDYQSERGVVLSKVLADWWAPLENTGNPDNTYTNANAAALTTYINMAHHDTVKVGCGVQTCAKIGKTLVQCAYDGAPYVLLFLKLTNKQDLILLCHLQKS